MTARNEEGRTMVGRWRWGFKTRMEAAWRRRGWRDDEGYWEEGRLEERSKKEMNKEMRKEKKRRKWKRKKEKIKEKEMWIPVRFVREM